MTELNYLLLQRKSNNPYYESIKELVKRILWDLNIEAWRSRSNLKNILNKYQGQKAVILCNGPSLAQTDFDRLNGTFTFGLNKINLLFDKTSFRPNSIVAVNPFVIEQNLEFFNETDIDLYVSSNASRQVRSRKSVTYLHASENKKFAQDCSVSIYEGFTVTFVAMQLAFHMGFSEVALVGCDHNFATKGIANLTVTSGESDPNHFDPNYFAGGVKWQLPDLFESEVSYTMAKNIYELHGRRIVNATQGGKLELFERDSLENFINS